MAQFVVTPLLFALLLLLSLARWAAGLAEGITHRCA
jgi:hypothetical protein